MNVGRADDNLALNKQANQKGEDAVDAEMAVDGDIATYSCTQDDTGNYRPEEPWWSVDLGDKYTVGKVVITFPTDDNKCSYIHMLFQQPRANIK